MNWVAVLATCAGCYLLKAAGMVVPAAWLDQPRVRSAVTLLPVALLSSLVVSQTFSTRGALTFDARAAGLAAAAAALALRAPLAIALAVAVLVTALVRLA